MLFRSTQVSGKVIAMWMPIMLFFYMVFEHSIVNMFLFPSGLLDSRYRNGFVSQLELLDAQRSELRNRRQALQVKTAQYLATVGLIRALGGGWNT